MSDNSRGGPLIDQSPPRAPNEPVHTNTPDIGRKVEPAHYEPRLTPDPYPLPVGKITNERS